LGANYGQKCEGAVMRNKDNEKEMSKKTKFCSGQYIKLSGASEKGGNIHPSGSGGMV